MKKKFFLPILICFIFLVSVVYADTESDNRTKLKVEGGEFYSVPVDLWHAFEDRESMGNKSMKQEAILHIKDGEMTLFIGSDKMTVSGITASLINLYYDNGSEFVKATPYAFDMKVEGYDDLRPEVFTIPIKNKDEYLTVMVDPKVEPMGDDPIKARIRFDFDSMKEIQKSDATLVSKAENGSLKVLYDASKACKKRDKGVEIVIEGDTFEKDYTFYANAIRGRRLNKLKKDFDSLSIVEAFELSALADMPTIPYDVKYPINSNRQAYQPSKPVKVRIPMAPNIIDLKVYAKGEENKELDYVMEDNFVVFEVDEFVPFIFVYKKDMTKASNNAISSNSSKENTEKKDSLSSNDKKNAKELIDSGINQEKTNLQMINISKKRERHGFIWFFIIFMSIMLVIGIYFAKKYYIVLSRELEYAKELELKLSQRKGVKK